MRLSIFVINANLSSATIDGNRCYTPEITKNTIAYYLESEKFFLKEFTTEKISSTNLHSGKIIVLGPGNYCYVTSDLLLKLTDCKNYDSGSCLKEISNCDKIMDLPDFLYRKEYTPLSVPIEGYTLVSNKVRLMDDILQSQILECVSSIPYKLKSNRLIHPIYGLLNMSPEEFSESSIEYLNVYDIKIIIRERSKLIEVLSKECNRLSDLHLITLYKEGITLKEECKVKIYKILQCLKEIK